MSLRFDVPPSHSPFAAVFLLNSKEEHDMLSTVLRIMHDAGNPSSSSGLKFEDPNWWKHMPSLKPLGFTCLVTDPPPGE